MLKHRNVQSLKKFLNTGLGRFSVVVVVTAVLLLATVLPGMLTRGVSDKDRELAAAVVDMTRAENKVINGSIAAQFGGINANVSVNVSTESIQKSRGELGVKATIGTNTFDVPVEFVYNQVDKEQYYKISNLDSILKVALNPDAPVSKKINSVSKKIDDNWLRLSSENTKSIASSAASESLDVCTPQLFANIQSDSSAKESIAELLASDTLFVVDSVNGIKNGNEYKLTINSDKAEKFIDLLKQTELFKSSEDCNDDYDPFKTQTDEVNASQDAPEPIKDKPVVELKLTVNDNSQITSLAYSSKSPSQVLSVELVVNSDKNVAVAMPKSDIVDYSTISDEVSGILKTLTTPPDANGTASNLVQPYGGM